MDQVTEMRATADALLEASRNLLAAAREVEERGKSRHMGLRRMAEEAGLPSKPYYSLTEIAQATGISRTTLDEERRAGRMRSFLPVGCERGLLVKCEWFDEWIETGTRSGVRKERK